MLDIAKELEPSYWDTTDPADEDMSPLRENVELERFSDEQLQWAWFNFCREVHLCSWVSPEGRDKHFVAYLLLKQSQGEDDDELDWDAVGTKVREIWPSQ